MNAVTLLAVLIAAGLSQTIMPEHSMFAQPLVGVVLLVVLFSYDREGYRDSGQSLAFGAVAGYCATRVLYPLLADSVLSALGTLPWFSIIWIIAALTFWAIDISRMAKRAVAAQQYAANPVVAQPAAAGMPAVVREEPVRVQPAPFVPAPAPPPSPVRASSLTSLFSQAPVAHAPVTVAVPDPPKPVEEFAAPPPVPVGAAATPTPIPAAQAVAVPQGSGKPATIYLNIVGAGLACLRPVQAEHLGKDYYLITEPVPTDEAWEFQPGQVVRCQKRNLSSGKAMVAVQEAPRAS